MYKWKNIYGGVGQVDMRWVATRTLAGVALSFVAYFVGAKINNMAGGATANPKTDNKAWRQAEAQRRINENIGVLEGHKIGQPAIYNEIPAKNWTGEEETLVIRIEAPKSQ